ncbi:hypothetical protein AALC17_05300 [Oscillospiraceae bacterium 38-13]
MTNREMLDDLLRRLYDETLAILEDETPSHIDARRILQFSVDGFSHAMESRYAAVYPITGGTGVCPGSKCLVTEEMQSLMEDIFKRLYDETLGIVNSPGISRRGVRDALKAALETMAYAARN